MPYIALSLTVPTDTRVVHRLSHDLESLFLVLLHILGFWAEPGVTNNVETTSYRVSRWHTEANPKILLEDKTNDLRSIYEDPGFICDRLLAPHLSISQETLQGRLSQYRECAHKRHVLAFCPRIHLCPLCSP